MVVEHTNKSKYLSDKLTLPRYVGQHPYKPMLALWWKQIILFYIQNLYLTILKLWDRFYRNPWPRKYWITYITLYDTTSSFKDILENRNYSIGGTSERRNKWRYGTLHYC